MKILTTILCSLGIICNLITPISSNDEIVVNPIQIEYTSISAPSNYQFSDEELLGTEFEGKKVEIIDGEFYVDGKSVLVTTVWLITQGSIIAVGLISNGTFQQLLDTYQLVDEAISTCLFYWNRYQIITDMYLNSSQQLTSFKMSDGNECAANPSGTSFACKFSLRGDESYE